MDKKNHTEPAQTGFDAISGAARALYPGQEGVYYGTLIPYTLGGGDPLDGVEIWKSERGVPHWHYITYGFTELYEKESGDPDESGYGFELTFRLKRGMEEAPPVWPVSLLQNLARYVFSSGNTFGLGHHINCNGPIALETDTQLTALGFCMDPELGELDTPNGHFTFLQAAAITEDEMNAMMCWNGEKFLALMARFLPMCAADLDRDSLLKTPAFYSAWRDGMERDGSSTAFLYMDELDLEWAAGRGTLRIGAGHAETLARMLKARVGTERTLFLQGQETAVQIRPGSKPALVCAEQLPELTLTSKALEELCRLLAPHAGTYSMKAMPLTVELVPTRIMDRDGTVIDVIE